MGLLWTLASTQQVDLTPNIDSVACAAGTDPVCKQKLAGGKSADDAGHNVRFADLSLLRYRGFLGVHVRYRMFALASEFMFDLRKPHDADASAGRSTPRQWTVNVAPSLSF
jgi:hypothetical protein